MLALRLLAEGGEGPNTELLGILWVVLGLFVLAIIVGWVASLSMPKQAEIQDEAVELLNVKDGSEKIGKNVKVAKRKK